MESYTLAAHSRLTDDPGPVPGVLNLEQAAKRNHNFRTVLWTGKHFQLTVMCIPFRGEIGLELHPDTDQLIRVEDGQARIRMGKNQEQMEHCHCLRTGDFSDAGISARRMNFCRRMVWNQLTGRLRIYKNRWHSAI